MGLEKRASYIAPTERIQNRIEHPVLSRMHQKAEQILEAEAIDPTHFIDLYGNENVARDLKQVEFFKSIAEKNDIKAAADIFEALVHTHTELSNWLGPNAETIRTSEYDDRINRVDLVVEFNEEHSSKHLALGVDVTFGSISMQKKFDQIKEEIEKDELAKVKYFESHGFKGSLKQLPRVVIGVELNKVIQLAGLWERGDNKILGEHITKDIIAKEIERQLGTFLVYARSIHAENSIRSYTNALNIMRNVRTVRNGFSEDPQRMRMVEEDRVYQSIVENLARFRLSSPK